MNHKLNITVVGAGYVGLVSGACFAELGFNVICVDKDLEKIRKLQKGVSTIYEPSLAQLMQSNVASKKLAFSNSLTEAIQNSDIIFITVGTSIKENSEADITEVENVIRQLAPFLKTHKVIVIKSTVPVGTCRKLKDTIFNINNRADFDIVSNPEFLRAGSGIQDFMSPDRIVIGTDTEQSCSLMTQLYQTFIDQNIPVIQTTFESSELIKSAANSFLATKIAFANEIACLCENLGVKVKDVLQGMGLDDRIGLDYLQPGPGFGGSCLAKDALTLVHIAKKNHTTVQIVESALLSNINHIEKVVQKIITACSGSVTGKRLAILGIAFKANTDDVRESTALYVISELISRGAELKLFDPIVKSIPLNVTVHWGVDAYDAIKDMDAIVIMTEWEEFRQLDLKRIKNALRKTIIKPTLIDFRNLYSPKTVMESGIQYYSIGSLATEEVFVS